MRLTTAWDRTLGSGVKIAILDSGIEGQHEDIEVAAKNLDETTPNNADDDGNGWIDDAYGWDFESGIDAVLTANQVTGDNDPGPSLNGGNDNENHGTICAGAAAARGFNGTGLTGAAPFADLLLVRVTHNINDPGGINRTLTTATRLANGIRYAAGRNLDGSYGNNIGADVLSMSLSTTATSTVDSSLVDATTLGRVRNGTARGAVVVAAANNWGSGWEYKRVKLWQPVPPPLDPPPDLVPGTYRIRWIFSNNNTAENSVWLDEARLPNGTIQSFQGTSLPSGWTTSATPWTSVGNTGGNHGVIGISGELNARSVKSGAIQNQDSWIEVTVQLNTVDNNTTDVGFHAWIGAVQPNDALSMVVYRPTVPYGVVDYSSPFIPVPLGDEPPRSTIDYPARHTNVIAIGASTQNAYRADYSQFNPNPAQKTVDFLAPAGFPHLRGITTTDRTGTAGYDASTNYIANAGGTSLSTPLVAGIAALVLSHKPTLSPEDVRIHLRDNCTKIGNIAYSPSGESGRNQEYGSGRLDAHLALAQGARDTTLTGRNTATGPNGNIYGAAYYSSGGQDSIFVCGSFYQFDGVSRPGVAKLTSDGTLDYGFSPQNSTAPMTAIAVQSDGKVIVSGSFSGYILRLNTNGSIDTGFYQLLNGPAYCIRVRSDGKIFIGGSFTTANAGLTSASRVALLNSDGSLDTSFDCMYGVNGPVYAAVINADNSVVIGGDFTTAGAGSLSRNRIAKLTSTGSVDTTFNPGTGFNSSVYSVALQGTRIVAGGAFTTFNGFNRYRIAGLSSLGALDTTFVDSGGANGTINAVQLLSGGKLAVAGSFTSIQGAARNYIARLALDGSNDPYFDPGSAANSTVRTVAVQNNHRLILGGDFTQYNGVAHNKVTRVHGK